MKRNVLLYGLLGGVLIAALKTMEYRYLVLQHSGEVYEGFIAAVFAALGIWLGARLTRPTLPSVVRESVTAAAVPPPEHPAAAPLAAPASAVPFVRDPSAVASTGLSARELEILELMAAGLSNREIAEKVFISENTVKTHSSRIFGKLDARRRTQAMRIGKQRGLIP